jgi:hypothetical protein
MFDRNKFFFNDSAFLGSDPDPVKISESGRKKSGYEEKDLESDAQFLSHGQTLDRPTLDTTNPGRDKPRTRQTPDTTNPGHNRLG